VLLVGESQLAAIGCDFEYDNPDIKIEQPPVVPALPGGNGDGEKPPLGGGSLPSDGTDTPGNGDDNVGGVDDTSDIGDSGTDATGVTGGAGDAGIGTSGSTGVSTGAGTSQGAFAGNYPDGVNPSDGINDVQVIEEMAWIEDVEVPMAGPGTVATDNFLGLPLPFASMAFGDGWAPINFGLLLLNIVIMLALALMLLAGSRNSGAKRIFTRRRSACITSVAITMMSLVIVVATQNISLPIKPIDAATLWLVCLSVANLLSLGLAIFVPATEEFKELYELKQAYQPVELDVPISRAASPITRQPISLNPRPRKGTWLTGR
jgi:hypothetical protein